MYDYYWYQIADLSWFEKKMIEGTRESYVPERFVFDIDYAKQTCATWPRSGRILGSEENRSNIPKIGGRGYTHIVFDELQS